MLLVTSPTEPLESRRTGKDEAQQQQQQQQGDQLRAVRSVLKAKLSADRESFATSEEPLTSIRLVQEEAYAFVHHTVESLSYTASSSSSSLLTRLNDIPQRDRHMSCEVRVSPFYNKSCFFMLELSWLVASSSIVSDWTKALVRNASRAGLDCLMIPCGEGGGGGANLSLSSGAAATGTAYAVAASGGVGGGCNGAHHGARRRESASSSSSYPPVVVSEGFDQLSAVVRTYKPRTWLHFRVLVNVLCAPPPPAEAILAGHAGDTIPSPPPCLQESEKVEEGAHVLDVSSSTHAIEDTNPMASSPATAVDAANKTEDDHLLSANEGATQSVTTLFANSNNTKDAAVTDTTATTILFNASIASTAVGGGGSSSDYKDTGDQRRRRRVEEEGEEREGNEDMEENSASTSNKRRQERSVTALAAATKKEGKVRDPQQSSVVPDGQCLELFSSESSVSEEPMHKRQGTPTYCYSSSFSSPFPKGTDAAPRLLGEDQASSHPLIGSDRGNADCLALAALMNSPPILLSSSVTTSTTVGTLAGLESESSHLLMSSSTEPVGSPSASSPLNDDGNNQNGRRGGAEGEGGGRERNHLVVDVPSFPLSPSSASAPIHVFCSTAPTDNTTDREKNQQQHQHQPQQQRPTTRPLIASLATPLRLRHFARYRPSIAVINRPCRLLHASGSFVVNIAADCSFQWSSNPCLDVPMPQITREGDVFNESIALSEMLAEVLGQIFEGAMGMIAAKEEEEESYPH